MYKSVHDYITDQFTVNVGIFQVKDLAYIFFSGFYIKEVFNASTIKHLSPFAPSLFHTSVR